jgi:hypothetical protein
VLLLAYAIFALRFCIIYIYNNPLSQGASLGDYYIEVIALVATNAMPYFFYAFASCGIGMLLLNKQHLRVQTADSVAKEPVNDVAVDFDDSEETDSDNSDSDSDSDDSEDEDFRAAFTRWYISTFDIAARST